MTTQDQRHTWQQLAQHPRVDSVRATTKAGSGHPTSSMSAADLMAVLLVKHFRYKFDQPQPSNNDRLDRENQHSRAASEKYMGGDCYGFGRF